MHWQRLLDVNLNRLSESLKFIEDYLRFLTNNKNLLWSFRSIRREYLLVRKAIPMVKLIIFRESQSDPGRNADFDRPANQDITGLLLANFTRAKDSSRILEELLKASHAQLSVRMKRIRFKLYDAEKTALESIKKAFDPYFHAILDEKYIGKMDRIRLAEILNMMQNNGVTMIQLRVKNMMDRKLFRLAAIMRKAISKTSVKYIINNRLDIALACGADGVHLGQDDLPVATARAMTGDDLIIGASAHTLREAQRAVRDGADYLGIGAIFATKTKSDAMICGLKQLRQICRQVRIPVIGIGGIDSGNFRSVFKAGAAGIAVASYLFEGDLKRNIRSLTES